MIKDNLQIVHNDVPENVLLVCVSKFQSNDKILEAYNYGERCFGENRPQEMKEKAESLPSDIKWHFIGNLQTNKVKMVIPHASLIHSVSNDRLLDEIERISAKFDKVLNVLIEVHVAQEESKHGFSPEEAVSILSDDFANKFPHINVCGIMGMASLTDNETQIRNEFKAIKNTFNTLKNSIFQGKDDFKEISMGMSGDYKIAIEEGATIVRIGSKIFL